MGNSNCTGRPEKHDEPQTFSAVAPTSTTPHSGTPIHACQSPSVLSTTTVTSSTSKHSARSLSASSTASSKSSSMSRNNNNMDALQSTPEGEPRPRVTLFFSNRSHFPFRVCLHTTKIKNGVLCPSFVEFCLMPKTDRPVIVEGVEQINAIETNQGWQRAVLELEGGISPHQPNPHAGTPEEAGRLRLVLYPGGEVGLDRSCHMIRVKGWKDAVSQRHDGQCDSELKRRLQSLQQQLSCHHAHQHSHQHSHQNSSSSFVAPPPMHRAVSMGRVL